MATYTINIHTNETVRSEKKQQTSSMPKRNWVITKQGKPQVRRTFTKHGKYDPEIYLQKRDNNISISDVIFAKSQNFAWQTANVNKNFLYHISYDINMYGYSFNLNLFL